MFHDRYRSIVTVGAFDSPNDPGIARIQETFRAKVRKNANTGQEFLAACLGLEAGTPADLVWYPDRTWNGRTYVPVTTRTSTGHELFGHVSFVATEEEEPRDFSATADSTTDTSDANPDWTLDLCEDVVGSWRGELQKIAAMTLVWGRPLVSGGAARWGSRVRLYAWRNRSTASTRR